MFYKNGVFYFTPQEVAEHGLKSSSLHEETQGGGSDDAINSYEGLVSINAKDHNIDTVLQQYSGLSDTQLKALTDNGLTLSEAFADPKKLDTINDSLSESSTAAKEAYDTAIDSIKSSVAESDAANTATDTANQKSQWQQLQSQIGTDRYGRLYDASNLSTDLNSRSLSVGGQSGDATLQVNPGTDYTGSLFGQLQDQAVNLKNYEELRNQLAAVNTDYNTSKQQSDAWNDVYANLKAVTTGDTTALDAYNEQSQATKALNLAKAQAAAAGIDTSTFTDDMTADDINALIKEKRASDVAAASVATGTPAPASTSTVSQTPTLQSTVNSSLSNTFNGFKDALSKLTADRTALGDTGVADTGEGQAATDSVNDTAGKEESSPEPSETAPVAKDTPEVSNTPASETADNSNQPSGETNEQ